MSKLSSCSGQQRVSGLAWLLLSACEQMVSWLQWQSSLNCMHLYIGQACTAHTSPPPACMVRPSLRISRRTSPHMLASHCPESHVCSACPTQLSDHTHAGQPRPWAQVRDQAHLACMDLRHSFMTQHQSPLSLLRPYDSYSTTCSQVKPALGGQEVEIGVQVQAYSACMTHR